MTTADYVGILLFGVPFALACLAALASRILEPGISGDDQAGIFFMVGFAALLLALTIAALAPIILIIARLL